MEGALISEHASPPCVPTPLQCLIRAERMPSLPGSAPHLSREEAESEIHVFAPWSLQSRDSGSYAQLCMRLLCDLELKHEA